MGRGGASMHAPKRAPASEVYFYQCLMGQNRPRVDVWNDVGSFLNPLGMAVLRAGGLRVICPYLLALEEVLPHGGKCSFRFTRLLP